MWWARVCPFMVLRSAARHRLLCSGRQPRDSEASAQRGAGEAAVASPGWCNSVGPVDEDVLAEVRQAITGWVRGRTIAEIEVLLGGDPESSSATARTCPRSRELIGSVIPRAISFVLSIVSYTVLDLDSFGDQDDLEREVVESLSTAVRLGFDDVEKLKFAAEHPKIWARSSSSSLV
jgi:hypothetical protein